MTLAAASAPRSHPLSLRKSAESASRTNRLLILLSLLIPAASFDLYVIALCMLLVLAYGDRFYPNRYTGAVIAVMCFVLVTSAARFLTSFAPNLRDFKESLRYLPLLLLFSYRPRLSSLRLEDLLWSFSIYAGVDFALSLMQFARVDPFGLVGRLAQLYGTEGHVAISLRLGSRAIGLSPGPGQHGGICAILYVYFLSVFLIGVGRPSRVVLGMLCSAGAVLLAQSQTGIVAVGAGTVMVATTIAVCGRRGQRLKAVVVLLVAAGIATALIVLLFDLLRYAALLFTYGLQRSSYRNRTDKWAEVLGETLACPYWLPIGHGKDFFGRESRAMDSEYVYVLSVYGWVFSLVLFRHVAQFLFGVATRLRSALRRKASLILFFVIATGLILAWPSAFILDVRLMFIVGLLVMLRSWEDEGVRHARATAR